MRRTIGVFVGAIAQRVGELHYNEVGAKESAIFSYDAAWLAHDHRFAIDPSLPLRPGPHFRKQAPGGSVFHSAIADTEPDGWARNVIRRDHAKRRAAAREAGTDLLPLIGSLDYLLEVDDVSRVGALRFRDEKREFQRVVPRGYRAAPPLLDLRQIAMSTRAVEMHTETAQDLAYLRGKGTSLGGLRPKCSIIDEDGQLSIGKFPSVHDERAVTKGEVLALKLAAQAGIRAADARIEMSDGVPVAIIRRFDRTATGRIPYISAATLLEVDAPSESAANTTYSSIADAIRVHGGAAKEDLEELWRRIGFSILVNNVDDHLHNHGFLHIEYGKWRLSPAFDINPFPDRARELKTWIAEETGPNSSIDALMSVARYFGLSTPKARSIVKEISRAVNLWRDAGRKIGMTRAELDDFADAFQTTR